MQVFYMNGAGNDFMVMDAHHLAQAQGGNADFILGPLAFTGTAAVGGGLRADFLDGIEKH